MNPSITFESLREANRQRHQEWANGNDLPLSFRGVELAGEVGEACNELKKLERTRLRRNHRRLPLVHPLTWQRARSSLLL